MQTGNITMLCNTNTLQSRGNFYRCVQSLQFQWPAFHCQFRLRPLLCMDSNHDDKVSVLVICSQLFQSFIIYCSHLSYYLSWGPRRTRSLPRKHTVIFVYRAPRLFIFAPKGYCGAFCGLNVQDLSPLGQTSKAATDDSKWEQEDPSPSPLPRTNPDSGGSFLPHSLADFSSDNS